MTSKPPFSRNRRSSFFEGLADLDHDVKATLADFLPLAGKEAKRFKDPCLRQKGTYLSILLSGKTHGLGRASSPLVLKTPLAMAARKTKRPKPLIPMLVRGP